MLIENMLSNLSVCVFLSCSTAESFYLYKTRGEILRWAKFISKIGCLINTGPGSDSICKTNSSAGPVPFSTLLGLLPVCLILPTHSGGCIWIAAALQIMLLLSQWLYKCLLFSFWYRINILTASWFFSLPGANSSVVADFMPTSSWNISSELDKGEWTRKKEKNMWNQVLNLNSSSWLGQIRKQRGQEAFKINLSLPCDRLTCNYVWFCDFWGMLCSFLVLVKCSTW